MLFLRTSLFADCLCLGICRARTNSFRNGVATISHFSHTAADCYSVERGGIELRTRLNPCLNSTFPRAIRRLSKFSSSRALIETCDLCSEDVAASANVTS